MPADEQVILDCAYCGVPILIFWAPNGGGLLRGEYVLVGDWVFHPRCWDVFYDFYETET